MTEPPTAQDGFHIDSRLTVQLAGLLIGLVVQGAVLLIIGSWYMAKIEARIAENESDITSNRALIAETRVSVYAAGVDAARFDERLNSFDKQLQKFDRIIDRMTVERAAPPRP